MSANATLTCFGPLVNSVVNYLDYPPDWYDDCLRGMTTVIATPIVCNTRDQSEALAHALGFTMTDFSRHWIGRLTVTQQAGLKCWLQENDDPFRTDRETPTWEKIKAFHDAEFQFFYQPNC